MLLITNSSLINSESQSTLTGITDPMAWSNVTETETVTLTSQNRADLIRVSAAAATAVMQEMGVGHYLTKHYLTEVQKLLPKGWTAVGWHFGRIYWLDTVLQYTTWTLPIAPAGIKPPVTEGPFPPPPPAHSPK